MNVATFMRESATGPFLLRWERNGSAHRDYVLRGAEGNAFLRFPSALSSRAEGSVEGRPYVFEKRGILRPIVTVTQVPYDQEVATLRFTRKKVVMETIDGRRFDLVREGVFKRSWSMKDDGGAEEISLKVPAPKQRLGYVEVPSRMMRYRSLPLLLMLAWYVIVLQLSQEGY